jgi:hypothetical protein
VIAFKPRVDAFNMKGVQTGKNTNWFAWDRNKG